MKKLLFLTVFVFATVVAMSQETREVYCEVIGRATLSFSGKIKIEVDFGQENKAFEGFNSDVIKDPATGKPIKFNSMIDALNFMAADGWKLVNAYDVSSSDATVYHYVMRKEVAVEK